MNILAQIVESKKREIEGLYRQYDLQTLKNDVSAKQGSPELSPEFYQRLAESRATGKPFFITEFKRKSPSEGWINEHADLSAQIQAYTRAGASAISVLTDAPFFGGSYADLKQARQVLDSRYSTVNQEPSTTALSTRNLSQVPDTPSIVPVAPLLLQKDFILDPIQIFLAKSFGADLILLIAAILEAEPLDHLRKTAESIGLGVLVEVHDAEELNRVQALDFQVLGINNRDLKTFRTALNRVNVLKENAGGRFVIAESGVLNHRHFQMVRKADGFLIGTGLMQQKDEPLPSTLSTHFQTHGRYLFKACGIRSLETLRELTAQGDHAIGTDYLGINFSPLSKRRADEQTCSALKAMPTSNTVAVFYHNTEAEILETLETYPFKTLQLYAEEVSPEFVRSLKARVILTVRVHPEQSWSETMATQVEPFSADVDCFILDGAKPGSGERISGGIPADFPYPFLLAGGLQEHNLEAVTAYTNCIGVDIASGIEQDGQVNLMRIRGIAQRLASLPLPHDLRDRF